MVCTSRRVKRKRASVRVSNSRACAQLFPSARVSSHAKGGFRGTHGTPLYPPVREPGGVVWGGPLSEWGDWEPGGAVWGGPLSEWGDREPAVVQFGVDHCQSGETGSLVVQCGVDHCQSGETGIQVVQCGVDVSRCV